MSSTAKTKGYSLERAKKNGPWGFPGGPVVKTLHFQCREYRFYLLSLVRELISHMPCSMAKKKKRWSLD